MKDSVIYCAGVFDILHVGHLNFLAKAKSYGDVLVIGVISDEGVERYKHKRPAVPFEQRFRIIQALKVVDYAVRQEDNDPTENLKNLYKGRDFLKPTILVRADDYEGIPPGTDFIESVGGRVLKIPYLKGVSATLIKQKIINEGL